MAQHNKLAFGKFNEPNEKFDHVHVDIVGPLPYSDGYKYSLTCVDHFRHWPEAIDLPLVNIKKRSPMLSSADG